MPRNSRAIFYDISDLLGAERTAFAVDFSVDSVRNMRRPLEHEGRHQRDLLDRTCRLLRELRLEGPEGIALAQEAATLVAHHAGLETQEPAHVRFRRTTSRQPWWRRFWTQFSRLG